MMLASAPQTSDATISASEASGTSPDTKATPATAMLAPASSRQPRCSRPWATARKVSPGAARLRQWRPVRPACGQAPSTPVRRTPRYRARRRAGHRPARFPAAASSSAGRQHPQKDCRQGKSSSGTLERRKFTVAEADGSRFALTRTTSTTKAMNADRCCSAASDRHGCRSPHQRAADCTDCWPLAPLIIASIGARLVARATALPAHAPSTRAHQATRRPTASTSSSSSNGLCRKWSILSSARAACARFL
jgi:hypothetical protein